MKRLLPLLALVCHTAFAAPSLKTPEQVSEAINTEGAHAFLASLDDRDIERLFDHIDSGQARWVALVPKLASGADAGNAEGLGIALAYALPKNATAVLQVADPVEGDTHILAISRVCGAPFIEQIPHGYKSHALKAVAKVTDPDLQLAKERCLAALRLIPD